jgi:hypothetical protein
MIDMDILSKVLDTIHIKGALYFEVEAAEPWVLVNPTMNLIGSFMLSEVEHVIPFHIMLDNHPCNISTAGECNRLQSYYLMA